MDEICSSPPEDWLVYLYNYTLDKNFKDAVTIELNPNLNISCEVYLKIFKILCDVEKSMDIPDNWQCKYPIILLTDDEINSLERKDEYVKFLKAFNRNYVYEMMKLNGEIFILLR